MHKCVGCQYYDRNEPHGENKGNGWGKCRRGVPIVHPVSAKAYMVEGIWPHVRDDDWCGEWAAAKRADAVTQASARNLMMPPPVQGSVRPAQLPPGSLMNAPIAPIAPGADAPVPAHGRFGSD